MYIKRYAEYKLAKLIQSRKVGIILGARQVGKTTLVQHVLASRKSLFLNFDIEIDKQRFLAAAAIAPGDALRSLERPEVLVLDEAQRLPEAARIVKGWYDAALPARILMLGSSSLNLLDQAAESLTGRNVKLMLPPLLFEESLRSMAWASDVDSTEALLRHFGKQVNIFLLNCMAYGTYPEVVLTDDKQTLLRNLSSDYLWKDVLQSGLIRQPDLIKRLLMLLAHQVGSEISVNELAAQLHMARPTVEHYLDLLEQTYVIFRLPSFSSNPRKEISKGKKIYFWDTGIRNALLNEFSTSDLRPDIGALWENWVIAEVAKRNLLEGSPAELFFWRTRSQSEVDLICKKGGGLKAFEIKWRARRSVHRAFQDMYGVEVATLDCRDPFVGESVFGASTIPMQ